MAVSDPHPAAEPSPRRRLLFLAPFPPRRDAPHGGGRVIAGLLAGLAERHDLALLCLRGEGEPPTGPELRARGVLVEELPRPGWRRSRTLGERLGKWLGPFAGGPFSSLPGWARACSSRELAERLMTLAGSFRPEIVQAEYHVMAQYLPVLRGFPARRVLAQVEPGVPAARELLGESRGRARVERALDLLAWERFERRSAREGDAIVTFTPRDAAAMRRLAPPGLPIEVIPFGAEPPERALDPLGQPPPTVLFLGNYLHRPNADAAVRLAREILPRVRARCPQARLALVGAEPPEEVRALAGPAVEVTGFVPDPLPWLDRAAVVAAPLERGGGMRVKVAEALAAGKAVVASPLAAEGLPGGPWSDPPLLVATTDEDLASAIAGLLEDPERRAALAARARAWAREHLAWERATDGHQELYERLLSNDKGAR
jgi:polysaccharide biosynthesis protein PslH